MDFETLYNERVEKCSHETAFNKEEARALYNLCYEIRHGATVLEIGVEYGRSTAVIGTVAAARNHRFVAVDPIIRPHIKEHHLGLWDLPIEAYEGTSAEAAAAYTRTYWDLVHIDGDHTYEEVLFDCHAWLPRVLPGGYACFDDFGHPGLEGVDKAVQEYMAPRYDIWKAVKIYGNKLAVYRRI